MDESGKGDLFGPVVTACVIADKVHIDEWIKEGIRDSKNITDSRILKLDKIIRGTKGVAVETCFCGMRKYNGNVAVVGRASFKWTVSRKG